MVRSCKMSIVISEELTTIIKMVIIVMLRTRRYMGMTLTVASEDM